MEIELQLYRVFYITAREGNLSKAAQELYISQPAVSHSIKRLEELLGTQLFIRKSRGVELTPLARVLYGEVEQAYNRIEAAQNEFLRKKKAITHEIRINATEILSRFWLAPYFKIFSEQYPEVRIILTNKGTPEALNLVKNGKIDLALATLPAPESANLHICHYRTVKDCFVVGKDYGFLAEREISFKELAEYPMLLLRKGMNSRFFVDKLAKNLGVQLVPHMELESIDTLIRCAKYGCGVSFVVREFAEEELRDGELSVVPVTEKIPPRSIGFAMRNGAADDYLYRFADGLIAFNGTI